MAVVTSLESAEWQDADEIAWQETMQKLNKVGLLKNLFRIWSDISLPSGSPSDEVHTPGSFSRRPFEIRSKRASFLKNG